MISRPYFWQILVEFVDLYQDVKPEQIRPTFEILVPPKYALPKKISNFSGLRPIFSVILILTLNESWDDVQLTMKFVFG